MLTLSLEPVSGSITLFYAFVNGQRVIAEEGDETRTWSGEIPNSQVGIKTRVVGVGNASYKLTIDLPGTANDQSLEFTLTGGYHETEILI